MNKVAMAAVFLLLLVIVTLSCDQLSPIDPSASDAPTPTSIATHYQSSQQHPVSRPQERLFREVSKTIPGFGGYYLDAEGNLVAWLKGSQSRKALEQRMQHVADAIPISEHRSIRTRQVIVREGDYTFSQLARWRSAIHSTVFSIPEAIGMDLDEQQNRLVIGTIDGEPLTRLLQDARFLGIPAEAFRFVAMGPLVPSGHTLDAEFDSLTGGIALECGSFGFNAEIVDTSGFFSASHCSAKAFETDSSTIRQPDSAGPVVGTEFWDPEQVCGSKCRWSDATFYTYETKPYWFGTIARTQWVGDDVGSHKIDHDDPLLIIEDRLDSRGDVPSPTSGQYVDKIGKTTGWTSGRTTRTCFDINNWLSVNYTLLCQDFAEYGGEQGDSGAPVFIKVSDAARLLGIHIGENTQTGESIFSALANVENDFGDIKVHPAGIFQ